MVFVSFGSQPFYKGAHIDKILPSSDRRQNYSSNVPWWIPSAASTQSPLLVFHEALGWVGLHPCHPWSQPCLTCFLIWLPPLKCKTIRARLWVPSPLHTRHLAQRRLLAAACCKEIRKGGQRAEESEREETDSHERKTSSLRWLMRTKTSLG